MRLAPRAVDGRLGAVDQRFEGVVDEPGADRGPTGLRGTLNPGDAIRRNLAGQAGQTHANSSPRQRTAALYERSVEARP